MDPAYDFVSTVDAVNKLLDLQGRATELQAHWLSLDDDDRVLEQDQYHRECTAIRKLNVSCMDNLARIVRMNESERLADLQDKYNALHQKSVQQKIEHETVLNNMREQRANAEQQVSDLERTVASMQAEDNAVEMRKIIPYTEFRANFAKLCAFPAIECATRETLNALYKELANFIAFLVRYDSVGYIPDYALVSIMHDKLDIPSRVSFAAWQKHASELTCDVFFEFLKCHLDAITECENAAVALAKANTLVAKTNAVQPSTSVAAPLLWVRDVDQGVGAQGGKKVIKYSRPRCAHCGVKHSLLKCVQFKTSTYEARMRTIRQNRLCENCLLYGHRAVECDEGPCYRCKVKHNSIMCKEFWDKDNAQQ